MPRGDKSTYTDKQKRQVEHIEEGYEKKGVSEKEAEARAWATVNKETGGGKKSGAGRAKKATSTTSKKNTPGKSPTRTRTAADRSDSAKKAAQTRTRKAENNADTRMKATASSGRGRKKIRKKIRYAVIAQGYISQIAVLPAFANADKNSELVALISDDPLKLKKLSKTYTVPYIGTYDDYDNLLRSGQIDAVYIALPNHMHCDFTVRAARAGIHVLCEKPMAMTDAECKKMIQACDKNGVKLMIAYRLHFEKANLSAIDIVQSGKIGEPRLFNSVFTMQVRDEDNIRLEKHKGGGPLYDIGIYCLNAARYLFRSDPMEVFAFTANNDQKRFDEVEEMASVVMRFPQERLATFSCSFGAADVSAYEVVGAKGILRVDPAYEMVDDLKYTLTINGKSRERSFPKRDQFAPELVYFSDCILNDRSPEPSGREGRIDVHIINALYKSAESGRAVRIKSLAQDAQPTLKQEMRRAPVKKPELVNAKKPSGDE